MLLTTFKIEKIRIEDTPKVRIFNDDYERIIPYNYDCTYIDQMVVNYFWNKKDFKENYVGLSKIDGTSIIIFKSFSDAIQTLNLQKI